MQGHEHQEPGVMGATLTVPDMSLGTVLGHIYPENIYYREGKKKE